MPLGPNDPQPEIYFPKDFLVRLRSEGPNRRQAKTEQEEELQQDATRGATGKIAEMSARVQNEPQITALLIAPNRELAQQFAGDAAADARVSDSGGSEELSAAADAGNPRRGS